ncbi:hypothetical protein [Streptomyces sp. NPDC056883]|uniref:hypothetical protein n=1 Tax=Streptomyces sp. NPDC056883 TaxID=3345959 RepID=UPI0036865CBC
MSSSARLVAAVLAPAALTVLFAVTGSGFGGGMGWDAPAPTTVAAPAAGTNGMGWDSHTAAAPVAGTNGMGWD